MNQNLFFQPGKDSIEEWFETDLDNVENIASRCHTPELLNFKRPIIQFQILSLIKNYDYAGAFQIYEENARIFPQKVGQLLKHAKCRLNLQHEEAKILADKLQMKKELYLVARQDIGRLIEFFNSMKVKQFRGELNDFVMRLEILTKYLALYILENPMQIKIEAITTRIKTKNADLRNLSYEKCTSVIPGIEAYLKEQFLQEKGSAFVWGRALNALSTVCIINYLSQRPEHQRYASCAEEMMRWVQLANQVRNPAAHTIISITDDKICRSYGNKNSAKLCKSMQTVLLQVFGNEAKKEAFEIYEKINEEIQIAMM